MAAVIGAVIGVLLSYVIVRGKFFGRNFIEMVSLSGFALPGTVLGIGYLLAFSAPPLKLTGGIMILALNCVFRFLAVGVEAGISKLHQIHIEIEEASADLGASFLTTFTKIVLPIMFPAFIAGFIYTFMTAIVSLSAVVFLVSPGFDLAAVKIFDAAVYGEIGIASATTMKLVLIVMICMMILNFISSKTRLGSGMKESGMNKKGVTGSMGSRENEKPMLILKDIHKFYGTNEVLKGVSLEVKKGELVTFVGPSGCGKTTLLRLIGGFTEISSGDIILDGQRINDLPPNLRDTRICFQNYALFPHMTVAENVGYGLKINKWPKGEDHLPGPRAPGDGRTGGLWRAG